MSAIERGFRKKPKEVLAPAPTFQDMAVVAASGRIGRLFLDRAAKTMPGLPLTGIVRHFDQERAEPFPTVKFTDNLTQVLTEQKPEAMVVATPNQDSDEVLRTIRANVDKQTSPLTLIFIQNGMEMGDKAKEMFADVDPKLIRIVRVLVFTPVAEDPTDKTIRYKPNKLKAMVSPVPLGQEITPEETDSLQKTEAFLRNVGFKLKIVPNYKDAEAAKANANNYGSSGDVMLLGPREIFRDPQLRRRENEAEALRRKDLRAKGINPPKIWGSGALMPLLEHRWARIAANHEPLAIAIAVMFAKTRNDKPTTTAERVMAGRTIKQTEAEIYHGPFEQASTLDRAILEVLRRHEADDKTLEQLKKAGKESSGINLNGMRPKDRKRLLLTAAGQKPGLIERAAVKILGSDWFARVSAEFLLRSVRIKIENPENLDSAKAILDKDPKNSLIIVATDTDSIVMAPYGKAVKKHFKIELKNLDGRYSALVADKHENKTRNPIQGAVLEGWSETTGANLVPLVQKTDHYFSEQETATRNAHSMRQAIRKLRSGGNVLAIVPTGTRSLSGKLEGEAHEGVEALFRLSGDKVWAISMAAHHLRKYPVIGRRIIPFFRKVTITVGQPYNCATMVAESKKIGVPVTRLAIDNLASFLPEKERGVITIPVSNPHKNP
jgi:hypothetical protein